MPLKILHSDKQVAQLLQRDRAVGWVSFGQKWKTMIFCIQTLQVYLQSLWCNPPPKLSNSVK